MTTLLEGGLRGARPPPGPGFLPVSKWVDGGFLSFAQSLLHWDPLQLGLVHFSGTLQEGIPISLGFTPSEIIMDSSPIPKTPVTV